VTVTDDTTLVRVLEDLVDLSAGAVTVFLPLFVLAVPCAVLVVVPLLVAGAVAAVAVALLALPCVPLVLLARALRRR
jgi:hypothetical protein